jgi:RND family efflux transporter MFP subunit
MKKLFFGLALAAAIAAGLYSQGLLPLVPSPAGIAAPQQAAAMKGKVAVRAEPAPAVTVARAVKAPIEESVLVTGTLVPRLEVLVAPEVEGLRLISLHAEEGDRVEKGQILARLEQETLKALIAQNDAAQSKAAAAIMQARSNIAAAEARRVEASNALDRAKPLGKSGVVSESTLDQREAAARSALALLRVAQDGLKLAEAERAQVEAQRRDLDWKLTRTDVRAPVGGIISRRNARIGGVASGSAMAQPMFNIIAEGQIELEAEVPEIDLARIRPDQPAVLTVAGAIEARGKVRLVMPEVDRSTRQGRVRIAFDNGSNYRIGSFARGMVLVRTSEALVVPSSAVLFGADGAYVQLVIDNRIVSRKIAVGLTTAERTEIRSGLQPGDAVVAKAGTFLREGDLVSPVELRNGSAKVN